MTSIALGERYVQELDLLVEEGRFGNRSEAVRAAINALYDALPRETRVQVAFRAYKHGATLGRAAEIGRVNLGEFRRLLATNHMIEHPAGGSPPVSRK